MKAEEAQARFTAPADQLLSGTEIELRGPLSTAITKLEQPILGVAGQWPLTRGYRKYRASARSSA